MDKEVLNKFVAEMTGVLQSAKDFTATQMPDIFKEILSYNFFQNIYWIGIGLLLISIAILLVYLAIKMLKSNKDDDISTGFFVIAVFCSVIGLVVFLSNIPGLVQIKIAPKMYLIEYFHNLIK